MTTHEFNTLPLETFIAHIDGIPGFGLWRTTELVQFRNTHDRLKDISEVRLCRGIGKALAERIVFESASSDDRPEDVGDGIAV